MKNHESHLIVIYQKQFKITCPFLLSFDFQETVIDHILIETIDIFEIVLIGVRLFFVLKLVQFFIYFLKNLFLSLLIFIGKCNCWLLAWVRVELAETQSIFYFQIARFFIVLFFIVWFLFLSFIYFLSTAWFCKLLNLLF